MTQPDFWKDSSRAFLSEVWKEYSHADSRYATRDTFVIAMEAVTAAFDGPACLLAVWGLLRRRPWRYSVIIIVSVCQIYGDVLYYATCFMEGARLRRLGVAGTGVWVSPCSVCCGHGEVWEREELCWKENLEGSRQRVCCRRGTTPSRPLPWRRASPTTVLPTGFKHSRPEMQYFWVYFVIVNAIWIVVPLFCIRHSLARISAALARAEGKQKRK